MMQIFGQIRFEKAGTEEPVGLLDTAILDQWRIPFGYWFDQMVDWMDLNVGWFLDAVKWPFSFLLDNFVNSENSRYLLTKAQRMNHMLPLTNTKTQTSNSDSHKPQPTD